MHIGMVTSSISRRAGGIYDATRYLATHLSHLPDTKVSVFGFADDKTKEDLDGWGDLQVHYFTTKGPAILGYAPGLSDALNSASVDIVHQHGIWTMVSTATQNWHRETKKSYVISPHGMLDPWAVKNSAWKKRLARLAYEGTNLKNSACFLVGSESEADAVRSYGLNQPTPIIPNGVNMRSFRVAKPDGQQRTMLYLGRLHPKKGIENLIRAWQRIQPQNWQLNIAGEGDRDYEAQLASMISEKPENIALVGPLYHEEKDAAYESSDAFILPSFSEGMPMVVLDAFAMSLPALITDACNLSEAFTRNAAIRIEPSVESISDKLRELDQMTNEQLTAVASAGHQYAEKNFSWQSIAETVRNLYEHVIAGETIG